MRTRNNRTRSAFRADDTGRPRRAQPSPAPGDLCLALWLVLQPSRDVPGGLSTPRAGGGPRGRPGAVPRGPWEPGSATGGGPRADGAGVGIVSAGRAVLAPEVDHLEMESPPGLGRPQPLQIALGLGHAPAR